MRQWWVNNGGNQGVQDGSSRVDVGEMGDGWVGVVYMGE